MLIRATLLLALSCLMAQAQTKVLAIGDSLTREYELMAVDDGQGGTFPSPDSNPGVANTMNWVEILAQHRSSTVDFGSFSSATGYVYNYAIPGYDSNQWLQIIESDFLDPARFFIKQRMRNDYDEVDVVVIMVGGNDVNFTYGELYDQDPGDISPADFRAKVVSNLTAIIDEIRDVSSTVPIVLANVPDAGTTPDIIGDYPDPAKRATVTTIVNQLNQDLMTLANNLSLTYAPISELTDQLASPDPVFFGGIQMIKDKDPTRENRPHYLFCKEGLHPSTNGQAVLANILIEAINSATGSNIEPLANRFILQTLLGLNPDQPFIDWASTKGILDFSFTLDTDGDGIPNLGEYLLGLNPCVADSSPFAVIQTIDATATMTLDYTLDSAAARFGEAIVKKSHDLANWSPVAPENIHTLPDGSKQVRLPITLPNTFTRIEFSLLP